ncbi:hypothetical protein RZS08_55280, partial [Arthrospira platensis SPKY1]|nr:hypothetical protein [Arthrospira platensis SPKY1]
EQRGIGKFPATKFIDRFGVYWIGLIDNGILKFDPNRKPFNYFSLDNSNSNQTNRAITMDLDLNNSNSDEIIILTDQQGFFKFNLIDRAIKQIRVPVSSIYTDTSNAWNFVVDEKNTIW